MSPNDFENQLGQFQHRKPFEPFVVELVDGTTIIIDSPKLALGGGAVSLLTPDFDLIEFECENVRSMRLFTSGTPS